MYFYVVISKNTSIHFTDIQWNHIVWYNIHPPCEKYLCNLKYSGLVYEWCIKNFSRNASAHAWFHSKFPLEMLCVKIAKKMRKKRKVLHPLTVKLCWYRVSLSSNFCACKFRKWLYLQDLFILKIHCHV